MRWELFRAGLISAYIVFVFALDAGAAATSTVVVQISGQFSSNPNDIRLNGNPGPFPLPDLLGGSFAGVFTYDAHEIGIVAPDEVLRTFLLSTASIAISDRNGGLVYTIQDVPNPLIVSQNVALLRLGPSGFGQPGFIPLTPTDLRFELLNNSFLGTAINPPSAEALNAATFGNLIGGTFVELDDVTDPFAGWDLPAASIQLSAKTVPEPSSLVLLLVGIVLGMIAWLDRAWIGK
jgi:hypothetical protein